MTNYKVLIVDDSIENLKIIISILENYHPDYFIYQANNGQNALRVVENVIPDIIITDWEMPGIDGIELTRTLQKSESTAQIPIIIATGVMLSPDHLKTALEAGAIDYITKPINPVELLARMHSALTIANNYKKLIKEKESKIVDNIVFTNEVNSYLSRVLSKLNNCGKDDVDNQTRNSIILDLTQNINNKINKDGWQKFNADYNDLHPEYQKRLLKIHPGLTPSELKLSSMVRLGLSIKELAGIMFVAPESLRVSRSRLRKKLELRPDQNLQSYLSSI